MAGVAIAIKLSDRGPVFFRQRRAGLGGKPFTIFKFRTMVTDAENKKSNLHHKNEQDGPAFKIKHDPRITRVGRLLRETSLDRAPAAIQCPQRRYVARRPSTTPRGREQPLRDLAPPPARRHPGPHLHLADQGPVHRQLCRLDSHGSAVYSGPVPLAGCKVNSTHRARGAPEARAVNLRMNLVDVSSDKSCPMSPLWG